MQSLKDSTPVHRLHVCCSMRPGKIHTSFLCRYDFLVFAYQSVVISKLFFPPSDATHLLSVRDGGGVTIADASARSRTGLMDN